MFDIEETLKKIQSQIDSNDIVLYMKGSSAEPHCGFSATVVKFLKKLDVDFMEVNVLKETEFREAIKQFSNWPTLPQLYIKGKFIGGSEVVKEMFKSGELAKLVS